MKKPTILKFVLLLLLFLQADIVFSQNYKAFNREYNKQLKGDIINIGNNILNRGTKKADGTYSVNPNTPFSNNGSNDTNGNFDMYYINVDPIPNSKVVFSSSSATLTVPNNIAPAAPCYKVAYAALYWSGILRSPADRTTIANVKIKVPNTLNSNYQDVTGTVIHDIKNYADGIVDSGGNRTQAYACFADITSLLSATNPNGVYTVANVQATEGVKNTNGATGLAAGWSLFVVYEDNSLPTKSVSTFNGFFGIGSGAKPITTTVSGFTTPDVGNVNARVAFSALEGDQNYSGDYLKINDKFIVTTPSSVRPINNFFNSSITTPTGIFTDRTPNGLNTLGFDAGVLDITPKSGIISNKATSADITIGTNVDVYINYFLAFSVDVIAPNIKLTKTVQDASNNPAENTNVTLGQELRYTLGFKNSGNDSATAFTITDQLPINTNFNFPTDIFKLPTGMTVANNVTYNAATRTITFTVPNSLVEKNDPPEEIRFKVHVVDDCASLTDACSNVIRNSALSSYRGNPAAGGGGNGTLFGDTSYADINSCNATPQSTNFLVGLDACKNRKAEICLAQMEISASGGYKSYKWSTSPTYSPVLGTGQKLTITGPGKYYVYDTANPGCTDLEEIIEVKDGGGAKINPIIAYADNKDANGVIPVCDIDGKPLPKIFLCGAIDFKLFNLNLPSSTIVWEKTSCERPPVAQLSELCADERTSCRWVSAGVNGSLFTADTAGYYRVTISSNGCKNTYYFNVYKSDVTISETHKNILCSTPGSITVDKLTGYEFSLTHVLIPANTSTTTAWGGDNIFPITTAGNYIVNYRLKNVNPTCTYKTNQIIIAKDDFTAVIDNPNENPLCYNDKGRIQVSAASGFTGYYFTLYEDGIKVQELGPLTERTHAFENLTPGKTYKIDVFTKKPVDQIDCFYSVSKLIPNPASEIKVTSSVLSPLTACEGGKYKITASGGTPGYSFFVDGSATEYASDENGNTDLNSIILSTPTAKDYTILVRDSNLCEKTIVVKVANLPKPTITVNVENVNCYGVNAGKITIDASPADSGYTVLYSLDGGEFSSISPITNLAPKKYSLVVKYVLDKVECLDPERIITITGPNTQLTASAGVSELAGCGLPGFEYQGKIRITNVQGGKPLYTYSFDNQKTWINENESYVDPGKYTVYVKDGNGCIYEMKDIILEDKPADPSIDPNPEVVYNCNGTAKATIVVNNTGGANYTYEYYIDTKPNTPITSNVFNNVPVGKHEISVKYKAVAAATYSNLLQEDFGIGGYTTTPGISSKYCFEDETTPHPVTFPTICGDINDYQINDGKYAVASSIKTTFGGTWVIAKDHTLPTHKLGRFLCVNIGSSAGIGGIIYSKPIKDVIVDQPVIISLWAENLMKSTTGSNYYDPELTIQLVNDLGGPGETIVATTDTANPWKVPRNEIWNYKELSLNPGAYNNLSFVIRSYNDKFSGNDLLVDDIWVRQLPKSCITEKKMDVIIQSNKEFKVSEPLIDNATCNDKNDGKITLTVENFDATNGFKYSIDNGGIWKTATTSPFTITGLAKGSYKIIVKNDDAGLCSSSFSKEITAPETLTATASITKPATCLKGASITAVPSGGSPKYTYELYHSDGTIYGKSELATFDNVPEGSYFVIVKDKSDCASSASDPVEVKYPTKPKITLDVSSDLCYDTANKATIVVNVEGGVSPFFYSLNGATAQKDNNKFEVGPGIYKIEVTDANGCPAENEITGIEIGKQIIASPRITKLIDCTSSPEAEITIDASEGIAPYTYKVSEDGGTTFADMTDNIYKTSKVGSYVFKVTDSKGCSVVTAVAKVDAKLTPTASILSQTDPKCNNEANGSFTVLPAGGAGPVYEFKFNGGTYGPSATYSNLNAFVGAVNTRKYTYQVRDSKGCESIVYEVTLTNPTKVAVNGSFPANTTCSTSTVITIIGEGGADGYKYNFDGGISYNDVTTKTVTNTTSEQTIKFYVKDANGCKAENEIKVPAFNPPTSINISVPAAVTCSTPTTSLTLTTAGGIAPITYEVTGGPTTPASNTTGVFTGLMSGEYFFKATDARGCTVNGKKTIDDAVKIKAEGSKVDELCFEAKNGTASFTVSDVSSTGNFTYTFLPNTGTPNVNGNIVTYTNLAPGKYTFVATDRTTGCISDSKYVTVGTATAIDFTVKASKISCNNKIAMLTITGLTGGSGSYTYAYAPSGSTVPTTAYGTTLTVDTADLTTNIDVYVKDVNNCPVKKTIGILTEDLPIIDPIAAQCYPGSPVSVKITGTFATPATFSKDGNNFGSADTFSLTPGSYKLTVKDKFGCTAFIDYVVASKLTITPEVVVDTDCTSETTIKLTSGGGTGIHTFAVSTDGGITYATTTSPYTATAAGTYKFRVYDSANPVCYAYTADIPVTVKPTVLTFDISHKDVKCFDGSTGSILVTPTSGKAPHTYSITRVGTPATNYTTNNPSGLIEGTYSIVVKDAIGCEGTDQVIITQPTELKADAQIDAFTCNTTNTKESKNVVITATGGTLPYSYSFNGGSYNLAANTLEVADNGKVQKVKYSVMDGNGCETSEQTLTIQPLTPPKIAKVDASPIYCNPATSQKSTATITLATDSGAVTSYTITSGQTNTTGATNGIFTDLVSGNYTFRATAANGCYDEFSINIPPLVSIKATASKLNDVYCFQGATGNIKYDLSNFSTTYSYTVNGVSGGVNKNDASFVLPNLGKGTYIVLFTDDVTSCTISTSVTINEPTSKVSASVAQVNANCDTTTSKVTVTASGGTLDYKYAYMQNDVDPVDGDYILSAIADLNPATTTQWDIWVKDANGCTAKVDITLDTDPTPSLGASVTNQCTASGNNFKIIAAAISGVAPYTYTINTGVVPSPANTFTVPAGTYTITVKDANSCSATTLITVNDPLSAIATLKKDITCEIPAEAKIDIEIFGGKAPYGYRVKVGAGTYSGTPIPVGNTFTYNPTSLLGNTYEFEISDSNGIVCNTLTNIITTTTPVTVTASADKENPTCNGFNDGSVEIKAIAGVSPFQYSFDGGTFDSKRVYGGLLAGTYSYQVKDAKGCVSTPQTITLVDPVKINATVVPSIIECNGNKPGSIKVDITAGGEAPFTYTIYNNAFTQVMAPIVTSSTSVTFGGDPLFPALLTYGDYYVTIVDNNGCEFKSVRTRILTNPYIEATGVASSGTCEDGATVTINVLTAAYPVTYAIFGQPLTSFGPTTDTSHKFEGLDHGTTYQFQVIDNGGCFTIVEVDTPPSPSFIELDPVVKTDILCFGDSTGKVDFMVRNYGALVSEIRYEVRDELTNVLVPTKSGALTGLTGPAASGSVTGLKAGNYVLYLKEFDGTKCNISQKFQITQPIQGLTSSVFSNINANCDNPAQVTLKTSGGTGPYTYAYALAPATPSAFVSGNVLNLDPGAAGTNLVWNVIVKDINSCTFPLQVTIVKDPSPVIALNVFNECAAQDAFTVVVTETTAGKGTYSIGVDSDASFTSIPGGLPHNVTGLHSGPHTIYIKDANGCIDSKTITIDAPLNLIAEVGASPDCDVNNGSIKLIPSGGSGAYTYSISPSYAGISIVGNTISNLSDGTYTVTITDNNNKNNTNVACSTTTEITLSKGIPVTFDAEVVNVACRGDATGSIKVNLLPGNTDTVYTYAILPIAGTQTGNVFSKLPADTYTITVTSGRGCSLDLPFTVGQPSDPLTADSTVTQYACSTGGDTPNAAVVKVNVAGGTTNYKYSFDGGINYYDTSELTVPYDVIKSAAVQTITYYVIDKNGCKTNGTATVDPFIKLTDIDFAVTVAATCPLNVATITLTVVDGNTPITKYEMVSPTNIDNGNVAVFGNIKPSVNYIFRVTDSKNCSIERSYKLDPIAPINIVKTSSINVSCNTANGIDNNGEATFTVSDFSSTGNYTIAVASTPGGLAYNVPTEANDVITLTGLVEGTYTVTITDKKTNCSKSANVVIAMPAAIDFTVNATKVYCSQPDSQITVSAITGGTANYTYAVVKAGAGVPAATEFKDISIPFTAHTNLTDLSWDVFVRDAKGCTSVLKPITVVYNVAPELKVPAQQCFVDTDITINFGDAAISTTYNGNKTFTVDGLPTGNNITFTKAGTYKIVLTDDNGCTDDIEYIIEERLIANATVEKDLFCEVGNEAAKIVVEVKGGKATPNYTYQMYLDGAPVNGPKTTTGDFTEYVTAKGDYTFEISDSNVPCTVTTIPVTVKEPGTIVLANSQTDVICFNQSNGTLTVVPSGGVAPYKFVLSGTTNTTGDTSGIYTGLAQGDYTVVVTDAKGCSTTSTVITIIQPPLLEADHSITANTSCSTLTEIVVEGKGGTGAGTYKYNFDGRGYDSVNSISVSNDGSVASVTYTVIDANGCETSPVAVPIVPLNKPSALIFSPTAITCTAAKSNVTVTATNGVGALEFRITEFNGVPTLYAPVTTAGSAIPALFSGLPFGDYKFEVTDSNKCSFSDVLTIKDVVKIQATGDAFAKSCIGTDDGKAVFTVSDFKGTYTYTVNKDAVAFDGPHTTSNPVVTLSNLAKGSYKIDILDDITSCRTTFTVVINDPIDVTVIEENNVNANCKTGAVVTVAGHGGTPGYTYSFVPVSPTATPGAFLPEATRELDPKTPSWYVYAKDQNGCISAPLLVNITSDPLPAGFTASVTSQCADNLGNYEIVITPGTGMGPFTYSIGGGFQSETTFTVKAAKAYDLVVRDKFGCEFEFKTVATILEPVILEVKKDIYPTCADGDGQVTASATGGSGNFSYTLDGVRTIAGTPAVFDKVFAGSHTIIVTDLGTPNNCTDKVVVVLDAATPVTGFNAIATLVSCNGGNDGTIRASIVATSPGVNDNPKYMYSLDGGTPQDSPLFTGLKAGNYTVSVISGRDCHDDKIVEVKQPLTIKVPNPVVDQYRCTTDNISNFASITVNGVSGGTGEYTYEFINGVTQVYKGKRNVFTETDYKGGSYTINVYDDNLCTGAAVGTYVILPFTAMENVVVKVDQAITCVDNENITATVYSNKGVAITGLNYSLSGTNGTAYGPTTSTDGSFKNLGIGNYIVTATNTDTNCMIQAVHVINSANTFNIIAIPENENVCFGTTTRVQLTFVDNQLVPNNDAGPFQYTITGGVTPITDKTTSAGPIWVSNLKAGQYKVVAKLLNKPECTVQTTFTINQPVEELAVSKIQSEITCIKDNNDGIIVASAIGGWDNDYEYELVGPVNVAYSTQYEFKGLTAGDYTINVKDGKGCIASTTAKLVIPAPIVINATPSTIMLTCYGDLNAVITVALPTGGQGSNYLYTLNTISDNPISTKGPQLDRVFTGLGAGTYSVTVTDGFSCTATSTQIVINEPSIVEGSLLVSRSQTCQTQTQLTLSAVGGTGPYTYSTDGNTVIGSFASSISFDVPVGTYNYYIKDSKGCGKYVTNGITIDPLVPLTIDLDVSSAVVRCQGDATAILVGEAIGGLGNYVYTLMDGTGKAISSPQTNGRFENLVIGIYRVKVVSGDCSYTSEPFEIKEPKAPLTAQFDQTNVSCFGQNDGKLVVTATGGTGVIKYSISPDLDKFDTISTFEKLAFGDYKVIVIDENGCNVIHDFKITQPVLLRVSEVPNSMIPEICAGDKNGLFAIQISGGTAPYRASLDKEKGPFLLVDDDTQDYNGLSGGKHVVYIMDNNGCTAEVTINMPEPVVLNPTYDINYDCVNNAQTNMVTVTVDKSNIDLSQIDYALDSDVGPFQPSNIFTNVAPGRHYIVARHTNGCKVPTASFDIKAYIPLTLVETPGQKELNIISVTAGGGAPSYEYSFNGEPFTSSNRYKIYKTGDYVVIVRDKNGCTVTITVPAIYVDVCLDNYFTPAGVTNTTWGPGCTNIYNNLEFSIFDRYGRVIVKYHYGQKWDGRYNGAELPSGDYWYVLKLNDPKDDREFVGHFTLYR